MSQYQEEHRILGMNLLFPDLSPQINLGSRMDLNRIGIVQVNGKTINFIHRTFAEYFAAELFVYWMDNKLEKNVQMVLVDRVFWYSENVIIQRFINDICVTKKKNSRIFKFFHKFISADYKIFRNNIRFNLLQTLQHNYVKLTELILENCKYSLADEIYNNDDVDTQIRKAINRDELEAAFTILNYSPRLYKPDNDLLHIFLYSAAKKKKFNPIFFKFLGKEGFDNIKNIKGKDPWDAAAKNQNWDLFFVTFEHYKNDESFMTKWGPTILCAAVEYDQADLAIKLIGEGVETHDQKSKYLFPEYSRLNLLRMFMGMNKTNHLEKINEQLFKELVSTKNRIWHYILQLHDVNIKNIQNQTFLHFAVAQNQIEIAKKLIEKGPDVNAVDWQRKTPIFLACENKCWDLIIESLGKINFDIQGPNNLTLLHFACKNKKVGLALDLIKKGAKINCSDKKGNTPVLLAALNGSWDLVTELLKLDIFDVKITNKKNETLLHRACKNNERDLVLELIQKGADINCSDIKGNTPALWAAFKGHWNLVSKLIKLDSFDVNIANEKNEMLLHWACRSNQIDLALELTRMGAGINCSDIEGNSPAFWAAFEGHWNLVSKLIKLDNFDVNIANEKNEMLPHWACGSNQIDLAMELIPKGADINCFDIQGNTPALYAAYGGHWDLVSKLIKLDTFDVNISNKENETLLHWTCKNNETVLAFELIQKGADINCSDIEGDTPALYAAYKSHWDLVYKLIKFDSFDTNIANKGNETLLHWACRNNEIDLAFELIQMGADINCSDIEGDTPAMYAAYGDHWHLVSKLIKLENFDVNIANKENQTLLHWACESNKTDLAMELVLKGADLNCCDIDGNTPAIRAANKGYWDLLSKLIILDGCDVSIANNENETLLHWACGSNKIDLVLELIKNGADLSCSDIEGNTPAMWAANENHWDLVSELIKVDRCNFNIVNEKQEILLHWACGSNEIDLALNLIQKGADINCSDKEGNTPAIWAANRSHWDLVSKLINVDNFDINIASKNHVTLLHWACASNKIDLALNLIEKGADVNFPDVDGNTALLLAAGNSYWNLAVKLIDLNASIIIINSNNETLLHLACRDNQMSKALELIDSNLDINLVNHCDRTPVFLAAEYGHWDLVLQLMKLNANPHVLDIYQTTVLHFALRDNQADIAKALIKGGGDVNAPDYFGVTPLSVALANKHFDLVDEITKDVGS